MKINKGKATIVMCGVSILVILVSYQFYLKNEEQNRILEEKIVMELNNERLHKKQLELEEELESKKLESDFNRALIDSQRLEIKKARSENSTLESENKTLTLNLEELENNLEEIRDENNQLVTLSSKSSSEWKDFTATYYDANFASTGKGPGHPQYGMTYSGRYVEEGITIAVDPNVIPLGSWVEIEYPDGKIEKRRADDIGSAIKGNKVDIYIPKASITSGKHSVKIRIL